MLNSLNLYTNVLWTAVVDNFAAFEGDFSVRVGTGRASSADYAGSAPALAGNRITPWTEAARGIAVAWNALLLTRRLIVVFFAITLAGGFVTCRIVALGLVAVTGTAHGRAPPRSWARLIG